MSLLQLYERIASQRSKYFFVNKKPREKLLNQGIKERLEIEYLTSARSYFRHEKRQKVLEILNRCRISQPEKGKRQLKRENDDSTTDETEGLEKKTDSSTADETGGATEVIPDMSNEPNIISDDDFKSLLKLFDERASFRGK